MIPEATQFYVLMPLQSCQKPQRNFLLLPESYERKLYPASTMNVETYHFQIEYWRNLATVVKENYLTVTMAAAVCITIKKYHLNRMPVPLIPPQTVTVWSVWFIKRKISHITSKRIHLNVSNVLTWLFMEIYALSPITTLATNQLFCHVLIKQCAKFNLWKSLFVTWCLTQIWYLIKIPL